MTPTVRRGLVPSARSERSGKDPEISTGRDSNTEPARSAKPFLKWAGGKTQLLDSFESRFPERIQSSGQLESYVEPFVGSGAVYFHLWNEYEIDEACLIDINRELIVGYRTIKRDVDALIEEVKKIEAAYLSRGEEGRKEFFYRKRDEYNEQMREFNYDEYGPGWVRRATRLIFLNRTCFNGLFRQNQSGEFNVPHGRYAEPTICFENRLRAVHAALQDAVIRRGSFRLAEEVIDKSSFVYFDPPYRPISDTSSFTQYSMHDFTEEDQRELAKFYRAMDERGADLMLSNSDPKNEEPEATFFEKLYSGFEIERVPARRSINSNPDERGPIHELIIRNYS
jgi:DNA adenine methylase